MSIPYIFLLITVVHALASNNRQVIIFNIISTIAVAFHFGVINLTGLGEITMFAAISLMFFHLAGQQKHLFFQIVFFFLVITSGVAFTQHLLHGFHNFVVFDKVLVSQGSLPFTMYFNFDKTIMALVLYAISPLCIKEQKLDTNSIIQALIIAVGCIIVIMGPAVLSGYIKLDIKFSNYFWLWSINNLLFVCFAEEVLFRGVLQNSLMRVAGHYRLSHWLPIILSSIIYGMNHFRGGITYMILSVICASFYGFSYYKTNRIACTMLVHFITNLFHFIMFSYPAAARF